MADDDINISKEELNKAIMDQMRHERGLAEFFKTCGKIADFNPFSEEFLQKKIDEIDEHMAMVEDENE